MTSYGRVPAGAQTTLLYATTPHFHANPMLILKHEASQPSIRDLKMCLLDLSQEIKKIWQDYEKSSRDLNLK